MSSDGYGNQDADIDLGGLVSALWRRRMLVLMSTVVMGGVAFGITSMVSPRYQAETRLLIESRNPVLDQAQTQPQLPEPILDEAGVASQVALLQSSDLIKQVARDLKLAEVAEFDPSANPDPLTSIMVLTGLMKNPLEVAPEERVLKEFTRKLQVYQVEKSRVIAIQFASKDPVLAAKIPNEMARVYLSLQSGAKLDTNSETAKWLEPEIANLREKVRDAEAKVASYRSSSDIFKTSDQSSFSEKQLNDISQELARVRGERANAEARAESVRAALKSGRNVDTLGDIVGSQMIQRLKESQSGIQSQIADLSTTLLDGHPRLKGLRSQLEGIGTQIRAETQKILSSLESEANVSRLREKQLLKQLETLKTESADTEEKQVDLNALQREATAQRQLLETYLSRYRQAVSRQDMNATPADARIISRASMPTDAYFPKTIPIILVSALAGFILSSIYVMLAELFSGRAIRQTSSVTPYPRLVEEKAAEHEDAPAAHPLAKDDAPEVADPIAEAPAFDRVLAPSLLSVNLDDEALSANMADAAEDFIDDEFSVHAVARHLLETDVSVAIAVSLSGDEGSASTVGLVRAVAEKGRKVILIDMTGSALPTRLMAEERSLPGITNLLCGEVAFADTIHGDRLSDAHVLPHGTANAKRAMRGADRLAMIIDALANAYDLVLVECGPANVDGVKRLARAGQAEIILSATDASRETIEETAGAFIDAGYEDVVLLFGRPEPHFPGRTGRKAA